MTDNDRQQRMAERILEDESLRGDLEDDAATALVDWASQRAASAAADPARPDAEVEAQVQLIRQAARAAARSGETEPRRLIALAEASFAPGVTLTSGPADATPSATAVSRPKPVAQPAAPLVPQAAVRSVGEATTETPQRSRPATTAADVKQTPSRPASVLQSASPAGAQPRRRRSRLARFLKRARGER